MRLAHAVRAVVVVLAALILAGTAHAQSENKAAAEAAFRQGRDLMSKGDFAAACMAFRSSQTLDPQLGTQYNLGLCYEKAGMLASAWGELTDLAARDTNAARRKDAAQRARKLEPKLVKLLIVIRESKPGLVVRRDGADITPLVGVATPVDPGTSTIEAEAPGFESFRMEASLEGAGTTVMLEIPPLTPKPEPVVVEPPPGPELPPPPLPTLPRDPGKSRRLLGVIVASVGFAGLATGGTYAMMAHNANQDAREECGGSVSDCRGDVAVAQYMVDQARSRSTIATIGLGVGAAAVVAGAVLYVTAPKPLAEGDYVLVPTAGRSHAGLALTGRF